MMDGIEHMVIGITGTKQGLTTPQKNVLREILAKANKGKKGCELHHCDGAGADTEVHEMAVSEGLVGSIVIYPPTNTGLRAFSDTINCPAGINIPVTVKPEKDYIERNKEFIEAIQLLVVLPKASDEQAQSKTWIMFKSAKRANKKIILILPDGKTEVWPDMSLLRRLATHNKSKITKGRKDDGDNTRDKSNNI